MFYDPLVSQDAGAFGYRSPCHPEGVLKGRLKDPLRKNMRNYNFYVYILSSATGTLYVGVTNNLERRISEHKQGLIEGFTKKYGCKRLVYYEYFSDINNAIAREKTIKGWLRMKKANLIKTVNPQWKDLSEEWS